MRSARPQLTMRIVIALGICAFSCAHAEDARPDPLTDVSEIAPIREWFEAHAQEPRLLLFLSPV